MASNATSLLTQGIIAQAVIAQNQPITKTGTVAAEGGTCIGFSKTSAAIGERFSVAVLGSGIGVAGGTIAANAALQVGANGTVITQSTGAIIGRAMNEAVPGDHVEVFIAPHGNVSFVENPLTGGISLLAGGEVRVLAPVSTDVQEYCATQAELEAALLKYNGVAMKDVSLMASEFAKVVQINLTGRYYDGIYGRSDLRGVRLAGMAPVALNTTNIVSVSGTGNTRVVVLQCTESLAALDIQAGDMLQLDIRPDGPSGGAVYSAIAESVANTNFRTLIGCWPISAVDTVNNRISITLGLTAVAPSPVVGGSGISAKWIVLRTVLSGATFDQSGQIGEIQHCVVDAISMSGFASVKLTASHVKNLIIYDGGSVVNASYCTFSTVTVNYGAFLRADFAIIAPLPGVTIGDVLLYMENGANATLEGLVLNNGKAHLESRAFATLRGAKFFNFTADVNLRCVNGAYVQLATGEQEFVNVSATQTAPAVDTAGQGGAYISTVATLS